MSVPSPSATSVRRPSETRETPSVTTEMDTWSDTSTDSYFSNEVCGVREGLAHAAGSCRSQEPLG
jgi:hypothetical protein